VWGYVKDKDLVPPVPASLEELRIWITEAVATIDADRFDICSVKRGNLYEFL
jgi:hypothetical protein